MFLHTNTFASETYRVNFLYSLSLSIYLSNGYGNDGRLTSQTQVEVLFHARVTSFAYDTTFHIYCYISNCACHFLSYFICAFLKSLEIFWKFFLLFFSSKRNFINMNVEPCNLINYWPCLDRRTKVVAFDSIQAQQAPR